MQNIIKKVDRVSSINEALELQDLGVNIIGVSMNDIAIYSDNRALNLKSVFQIKNVLQTSKLAIEIPTNYPDIISLIDEIGTDYIQILGNEILPIGIRRELKLKGVGIIYSGIEASYEDDPSWIMSKYKDIEELNASFYQIDLLGDIENSWKFFKTESPHYPEELQILDIVNIGKKLPLIITLDFNKENIFEIISSLSSVKGVALTLSESPNRNDIHCFDYPVVLDVLNSIKR